MLHAAYCLTCRKELSARDACLKVIQIQADRHQRKHKYHVVLVGYINTAWEGPRVKMEYALPKRPTAPIDPRD